MKIRKLIQKIVTEIEKSEILTALHSFIARMRCVLLNRRGTGEPEAVADVQKMLALVDSGEIGTIIVKDQSRLGKIA